MGKDEVVARSFAKGDVLSHVQFVEMRIQPFPQIAEAIRRAALAQVPHVGVARRLSEEVQHRDPLRHGVQPVLLGDGRFLLCRQLRQLR